MRVAVLGGGLQGCCLAIELADKGVDVTLIDRNEALLTRAAAANEGKIHLGYMYAADPSMRTARTMVRGALSFGKIIGRQLGVAPDTLAHSKPATYVVHSESQSPAAETLEYLDAVHKLIQGEDGFESDYFGMDLRQPLRRWSAAEIAASFNPGAILAAADTCEVAIDPLKLTDHLRKRVEGTPRIKVLKEHHVEAVVGTFKPEVHARTETGTFIDSFDHVVNALWEGRLAIDAGRGNLPARPWIHRLKYGVVIRGSVDVARIHSITIISGAFGEVVVYGDGSVYLTWYPACLRQRTLDIIPPFWPIKPDEPLRSEVLQETFDGLAALMPSLRGIPEGIRARATVRGGPIVAWGNTDIDDPKSELHQRFEIGVTTEGNYHSVDPGKLTCAPKFAVECARRILG